MRCVFLCLALVQACAPSPLYISRAPVGTPGEIPRDPRGEPIWDRIPPPPAAAPVVAVVPVAPLPRTPTSHR